MKYKELGLVGENVADVQPCFVDTPRFGQGERIAEQGDLRHVIYGRLEGDATAASVQAGLISPFVLRPSAGETDEPLYERRAGSK